MRKKSQISYAKFQRDPTTGSETISGSSGGIDRGTGCGGGTNKGLPIPTESLRYLQAAPFAKRGLLYTQSASSYTYSGTCYIYIGILNLREGFLLPTEGAVKPNRGASYTHRGDSYI